MTAMMAAISVQFDFCSFSLNPIRIKRLATTTKITMVRIRTYSPRPVHPLLLDAFHGASSPPRENINAVDRTYAPTKASQTVSITGNHRVSHLWLVKIADIAKARRVIPMANTTRPRKEANERKPTPRAAPGGAAALAPDADGVPC